MEDNYTPFQDNYQQTDGTTYVPFQDGVILESQGYYPESYRQYKCEYCGKPANPSNCHAHENWCPYSCEPPGLSIGSEFIMLLFIPIYLIIKKYTRRL